MKHTASSHGGGVGSSEVPGASGASPLRLTALEVLCAARDSIDAAPPGTLSIVVAIRNASGGNEATYKAAVHDYLVEREANMHLEPGDVFDRAIAAERERGAG